MWVWLYTIGLLLYTTNSQHWYHSWSQLFCVWVFSFPRFFVVVKQENVWKPQFEMFCWFTFVFCISQESSRSVLARLTLPWTCLPTTPAPSGASTSTTTMPTLLLWVTFASASSLFSFLLFLLHLLLLLFLLLHILILVFLLFYLLATAAVASTFAFHVRV